MGDGADELGQGGYALPQTLTGDVGLKDPQSIVSAPYGLAFRSAKGIYSMGLSMDGLSYLGAPAEDMWTAGDTVHGACLSALDNEVRWYLQDGRAIVHHYLANQWSVHRLGTNGVSAAKTDPITGLVDIIGFEGRVCRADRSVYTDAGVEYGLTARTGWLAFAEINGFGKFFKMLLLAKWLSAHNLTVTLEFDKESNSQSVTIPALTTLTPERFEIRPKTHRCESVRVTIEATGAGASLSLSALSFMMQLKPGFKHLGTGKVHSTSNIT
jgi:hypothetical protein